MLAGMSWSSQDVPHAAHQLGPSPARAPALVPAQQQQRQQQIKFCGGHHKCQVLIHYMLVHTRSPTCSSLRPRGRAAEVKPALLSQLYTRLSWRQHQLRHLTCTAVYRCTRGARPTAAPGQAAAQLKSGQRGHAVRRAPTWAFSACMSRLQQLQHALCAGSSRASSDAWSTFCVLAFVLGTVSFSGFSCVWQGSPHSVQRTFSPASPQSACLLPSGTSAVQRQRAKKDVRLQPQSHVGLLVQLLVIKRTADSLCAGKNAAVAHN